MHPSSCPRKLATLIAGAFDAHGRPAALRLQTDTQRREREGTAYSVLFILTTSVQAKIIYGVNTGVKTVLSESITVT